MNAHEFRPDRVVVSAEGHAVSVLRAERDYKVYWDIAFIRSDNWSLAAPLCFEKVAYDMWATGPIRWKMVVNRLTNTITYLDREKPVVVG